MSRPPRVGWACPHPTGAAPGLHARPWPCASCPGRPASTGGRYALDPRVVAEESDLPPYEERRAWTRFWLVDLLDGTKEFLARNGEFSVSIALDENGEPVLGVLYAPGFDLVYRAERGRGRRLTVRFHGLANPGVPRALADLSVSVSEREVLCPETDLRLRFEVPASQAGRPTSGNNGLRGS